ncbi:MAG: hypothetical protein MN733_21965 [Nitrososphaera sp.]|nr:hypothetical protein [Nitrososphaera sp.]
MRQSSVAEIYSVFGRNYCFGAVHLEQRRFWSDRDFIYTMRMFGQVIVSTLIDLSFDALRSYAKSLGVEARDNAELAGHPRIIEYFKKKVDEVTRGLAPHEKIKKIALLAQEFWVESGELTPTLKVRRKFVEDKHREVIDALCPKFEVEVN